MFVFSIYTLLALLFLIATAVQWLRVTYPYLKTRDEPTSPPNYATWGLGIIWHLFYALVIGAEKKDTPKGVYLHGAFLILTIIFFVLTISTGESTG